MACVKSLFSAVLLAKLLSIGLALSNPSQCKPKTSQPLQVWDDVLPCGDQRKILHEFASKSGLGHSCFSRPLKSTDGRNVIELALDAILSEIESSTAVDGGQVGINTRHQYVEYWSRQEWRHIAAHADVDENLAKMHDLKAPIAEDLYSKYPSTYQEKSGGYRYPIHGHVLYLQVGTDVKGPTCVFPGCSSGGDLFGAPDQADNLEVNDQCSDDNNKIEGSRIVQMISVPAVSGRLLRFNGADLHVVPRPHDLWMLPYTSGSADFEPESLWGRSVILFNVWPGDEDPPLDVPLDTAESANTDNEKSNFCSRFSEWKSVPISQPQEPLETVDPESKQSVKVWLIGNERRRDYPMRTVPLLSPLRGGRKIVEGALAENNKVTELRLRQL